MGRLIGGLGFEVISVTPASARRIAQAGDCFAYEVAKEYGCRLLYVGEGLDRGCRCPYY